MSDFDWFPDLPGWEGSHDIGLKYAVVDGEPRVVEIQVRLKEGVKETAPAAAITVNRLRRLKLTEMAALAIGVKNQAQAAELEKAAAAILASAPPPPDPRKKADVEMVAMLWDLAHAAGIAPRAYVVKHMGMSARTADRYIKQARSAGLIPEGNK